MTTELLQNSTLRIEAYSFAEFLQEYQEAVLNGYSLDVETNEHYPVKYGDYLTVTLVSDQWKIDKETPEVVQAENTTEEIVETVEVVTPVKPAGRPRKATSV